MISRKGVSATMGIISFQTRGSERSSFVKGKGEIHVLHKYAHDISI